MPGPVIKRRDFSFKERGGAIGVGKVGVGYKKVEFKELGFRERGVQKESLFKKLAGTKKF